MGLLDSMFGQSNKSQQGNVATGNQGNPAAGTPGNAATGYQGGNTQLQQPQNTNSNPNPAGGNGNPAAADPANSADPTKGQGQGSLMDQFKDWHKLPDNKDGNGDVFASPLLNVDNAKLTEATRKVNFLQGVPQDALTKALSGDAQALANIINTATQNAFLAATTSNSNMVDGAVRTYHSRVDGTLPERVRQVQISQTKTSHPSLNHPNAAPLIDAFKNQVAAANPTMTPAEVGAYAERYFLTFAQDITANDPAAQEQKKKLQPGESDFSSFLN